MTELTMGSLASLRMTDAMKIFFKGIYYLLIAAILLIALLLVFSYLPIPGNYKVLVVQSGSMEPAIQTGGLVALKPQPDYQVGQVITFLDYGTGKTITHRIYEIKNENDNLRYLTKGDANNAPDQEEVKEGQILGSVFLTVPYLGYLVEAAKQPYGFLAIIVIPALLIIFDEIKKIIQEILKMRKKQVEENA